MYKLILYVKDDSYATRYVIYIWSLPWRELFKSSSKIIIGGTQYFNSYILPLALQKFNLLYPGITIELKEDNSAKISDLLLESSIDLMFSCNEINDNEFTIKKVFRDELILGVPYSFSINKHLSEFALSKEMIVNDFYLSDNCPCVPIEKFKDIAFLLLTQENNL